jgi:hypothetical protein
MTELTYVGPDRAESHRFGTLERGRVYQEADDQFAAYLATTHPDHWRHASGPEPVDAVAEHKE